MNTVQKKNPLYKVTASLLNSWGYLWQARDEYSVEAYESFLKTLQRIKEPPTFYMQRGIDFEEACVNGQVPEIFEIIRDGTFQYYAEKDLKVDGLDIRLLGYLDVLKAGHIYDIKRTNQYDLQKYFPSYQHHAYFALVPEAIDFTYLIAYGRNDDYLSFAEEKYDRDEATPIEEIIHSFFVWLKEMDLFETYKKHWQIDQEKKGDDLIEL